MAYPAMMRLVAENALCGIATADNNPEVAALFAAQAQALDAAYCRLTAKTFKQQLSAWISETQPDVVFVMTFPWRIPASVYSLPRLGFLNFHYGLLPQMRGADPIFEAIRQQHTVAGTTVHVIDEGLDTGPIVAREEIPVNAEMTYGMLSAQCAYLGEKMCLAMVTDLKAGKPLATVAQDESQAKYWPKVGAEVLAIRWDDMDSTTIKALVKSCNPIAKGVPITINNWKIGLCEVMEVNLDGNTANIKPGTIIVNDVPNGLIVYCKDGKGLRLEVVYTEEGYFPGYKLSFFGINAGMILTS